MDANPTVSINTLDGNVYDLKQDEQNGLKARLKGQMLLPGDAGYHELSKVWNAMIDRKPALIVRCLGTADVIAAVQFARQHNLLVCIKSGGHNVAGLATAEGALMLDMSLMRGVWVDPAAKVAHAQAGCQLGDVDRETQLHGLAAVLGFVSMTGITGLTLGGGFGYLTRRFGYTTDNVLGFDIVTAEGKLVHASSAENPDLFWGLRGGGGNFGVVTSIDYQLYPIGPEVVGGFVAWPISDAPAVLDLFHSMAESAPPELTLLTVIRQAPAVPWLPKEWHAKHIIMLGACYSGDLEAGEKAVAPIKSLGHPIGDILVRRPYVQLQTLLDAANPPGRRHYWKSEYLAQIQPELLKNYLEHGQKIPSPFTVAVIFQLGGALNEVDESISATGNRDTRYVFNLASSWENREKDEENIAWARTAWTDLKQFSTGGTYVNFLPESDGSDRLRAALGKHIIRLAEIKAKWDPTNMFRTNWNIAPALGTPAESGSQASDMPAFHDLHLQPG